jgi:hypothetical protein
MHFVNQFLRASHACTCGVACTFDHPVLRHMTMYLLELSRVSFDLSYRPPSLLTAAAVYLARATLGVRGETGFWSRTLEYTTGYSVEDVKDTVIFLLKYHLSAETNPNTHATFTKYRKRSVCAVAGKTAPRLDELVDLDLDVLHEDLTFDEIESV